MYFYKRATGKEINIKLPYKVKMTFPNNFSGVNISVSGHGEVK